MLSVAGIKLLAADGPPASPAPILKQYCFQCHGSGVATAGVNLERLTATGSIADTYLTWERVKTVLASKHMPPPGLPQPTDEQRGQIVGWIQTKLDAFVKTHAGDPGRVTVRRLTSGEYNYAIHDLTGLDLDLGIDASNDSVGGEGFTNFGDVQFMQDANLERISKPPRSWRITPWSAPDPFSSIAIPARPASRCPRINRVKEIDTKYGYRTVSGEGGFSFGLDRVHQGDLRRVGISASRGAGQTQCHPRQLWLRAKASRPASRSTVWSMMNQPDLAYPSSEMAARFHKLPVPPADLKASVAAGAQSLRRVAEVHHHLAGLAVCPRRRGVRRRRR